MNDSKHFRNDMKLFQCVNSNSHICNFQANREANTSNHYRVVYRDREKKMFLAHIFLPAMLLVICRSQQAPAHLAYGNEENVYGNLSPNNDAISTSSSTNNDELLDRYRHLTAKSLIRLYDSCKVHDFLQNLKHNIANDIGNELNLIEKFTPQNRF